MRLVLALVSVSAACGEATFVCAENVDCTGAGTGVCQPDGFCSFPDADCESGQRYGEHAGGHSGQCVDPSAGTTSSGTSSDATTIASLTSVAPESSESADDAVDTTSAISDGSTSSTQTSGAESGTSGPLETSTTGDPVDPDLLLWLRFEQGDEFVNEGVVGGVATCEQGCPLQADGVATFDGTDDCLVAPWDDAFASAAWTGAAWLWRTDEVDSYYYYVLGKSFGEDGENSWELFVYPDVDLVPVLQAHIDAPVDVVAEIAMPPSRAWIHVATTWDGATLRLWLDGQAVAETNAAAVSWDDHPVQIGCDDNGTIQDGQLGGRLDDVRVYGRALDAAEIAALAATAPSR